MKKTLSYKILENHLVSGKLITGKEITVKIDQTLTQDSTGTMVYLELEAMGIEKVKTEKSVAYIDHNTLQTGFENADDHAFIESVAKRHGIIFQKAGGGICHQLHMENYGIPGKILLGSDSHTPTGGGIGMIAIGAGGLDVATAMALGTYTFKMPEIFGVKLVGKLSNGISAKDVILEVLRKLTVKGGVGRIIEYFGSGIKNLSASDRATITNMGAELGATTSVFPSDDNTLKYFKSQNREKDFVEFRADENAEYIDIIEIDLSKIIPLAAKPHSPDNIEEIYKIGKIKIDQVAIGSCTNSSYTDLMKTAEILKGKKIAPNVSLVISPGSANILSKLADNGALASLINSGARIIENACGPCIGMGQSPKSNAISIRTFNRNFKGRSGTNDANIYLVSPETAAISALKGYLTDLQTENIKIGDYLNVFIEQKNKNNDSFVINKEQKADLENPIIQGPNIKPFPINEKLEDEIFAKVSLITNDNITTDDIMPSDSSLLPYRSNIPYLANFAFRKIDEKFAERAKKFQSSVIIGGDNYGQGSSREHAALVPLYLGIKFVLAKSFARIHRSNLINCGIIPLVFENKTDYDKFELSDELEVLGVPNMVREDDFKIINKSKNISIFSKADLTGDEIQMILSGGKIEIIKSKIK
ncbi:MAG: aconitate hydratase [Clostridiales Family XIII bacterium]|jgi:aconitate hydratase|nr:aconitate hydratase [Clostridiales Family XIII bacterium]